MAQKSFAEKFRPLTHVEIVGNKPLRVKIGDTKYYWEHRLMRAIDFARFFEVKDGIIKLMTDAVEFKRKAGMEAKAEKAMAHGALMMARILLEVCELPDGFISRFKFRRAFLKHYTDHIDELFTLFEHCLAYNARLLRFAEVPSELRSVSGNRIPSDGFLTLCGDSISAHNEPWIFLCERLESKKQQTIGEYYASEEQRRKSRLKR